MLDRDAKAGGANSGTSRVNSRGPGLIKVLNEEAAILNDMLKCLSGASSSEKLITCGPLLHRQAYSTGVCIS